MSSKAKYISDPAGALIESFYETLVSKEDQMLLDLAFAKQITQADLDRFLQHWDIEKFGGRKSLLLSYVMKTNPDLVFSDYEKPRLEGLLKYHRFNNVKLLAHYHKVVKALNEQDIIPVIFKGGAMKHIRPDLPRVMGDIDIVISDETEFSRARDICKDLGYVEEVTGDHSVDLHLPNSQEGTVDIHRFIPLETRYSQEFVQILAARATQEDVFGVQSLVPCFEDMVFLAMINLARNLNNKTSLDGVLFVLFDCNYLVNNKPDFDWGLVLQNIMATKTHAQAYLAIRFVNKIIDDILPESLLCNRKIHKKFVKHCDRIIFHHSFYRDYRQKYKTLSMSNACKSVANMKEYVVHKPRYFLLKRVVRKSHFLMRMFLIINSNNIKKIW